VTIRTATPADVPVLVALWKELRQVGGRAERAVNPMLMSDIADRFLDAISSPDCRIMIATVRGEPVGMTVLQAVRPDPLSDSRVVQIVHVVVAARVRRRGVGHALIAAAADYADELQVEHVTAGLYPSLRDASRFYARLGFAPWMVQRVAPVAGLRRRLGAESGLSRVDDVVRRRTRLRRPVPAQRTTVAPERVD
jgi:GNAT superfamily N-acetyltransferase